MGVIEAVVSHNFFFFFLLYTYYERKRGHKWQVCFEAEGDNQTIVSGMTENWLSDYNKITFK